MKPNSISTADIYTCFNYVFFIFSCKAQEENGSEPISHKTL